MDHRLLGSLPIPSPPQGGPQADGRSPRTDILKHNPTYTQQYHSNE